MKREHNVFLTLLLSFMATVCFLLGFFAIIPQKAVASTEDFSMVDADVRLDEHSGIRFTAKLNESAYEENCEYYVMIIPYDWFEEYGLSFGDDYYDVLINYYEIEPENVLIMRTSPVLQTSGDYLLTGSISNVLYKNSNRAFFGIAYKQSSDGNRIYAKENETCIKSLASVAVAATKLDDVKYTESEKIKLDFMIRRAFNQLSGKKENNQSALVFQTNTAKLSLSQGDTGKLFVRYADELGFDVTWESQDKTKATVDEKGLVTAHVSEGVCSITAKVYGQTCSTVIMFRPKMADNVLEDFSHEGSALNMSTNNCSDLKQSATWLESFEGAQGVGKCLAYKSMNALAVRFNRGLQFLQNLEFDCITVRLWMDFEEINGNSGEVNRTHALRIGTKKEFIPTKEWYDFTVTKNELASNCAGNTVKERYKNFCESFNNAGSGRFLMSLHDGYNSIPIYIDSITFGFLDIEEKTAPTIAGETFTLPTAKLVAGKTILSEDYSVNVKVGETEIAVNNGKIITQSGTTVVEYTFVYDDITYKKTYTFDLN